MGLISWLKGLINKMLKRDIEDVFGAEVQYSELMERLIDQYYKITSGKPEWLDPKDDVETINFADYIDNVTAGLVTLDISVEMPDTPRGQYLQEVSDYVLSAVHDKVSEALGNAGIMFKANGTNVDYVQAGCFLPTDTDSNGNILGCIFLTKKTIGKKYYRKYEWHRYEMDGDRKLYHISNAAFESDSENGKGDRCPLSRVKDWEMLEPEVWLENVEKPLFAYYKNPKANNLDRETALGLPIWANCIKELRDLDIAWSRKSTEIEDSKHITFIPQQAIEFADQNEIKLPRFLKGIAKDPSSKSGEEIHEHVATLLTEQRISDINSTLAMISTKCGFDQGFFVLDEKTGMMTATQVEADDQSTIRTIKNLRDPLKNALLQLFYAVNKFADLYTNIPAESWTNSIQDMEEKISFNFGDITYSYEADKETWWKYVIQNKVPAWLYFVKFEGMEKNEAKALVEEATPDEPKLFGHEE